MLAQRVELSQRADHRFQFARALETRLQFYPDDMDALRDLPTPTGRWAGRPRPPTYQFGLPPCGPPVRAQIGGAQAFVDAA